MNRQCQATNCTHWGEDGTMVQVSGLVRCPACANKIRVSDKVYTLASGGYSNESAAEARDLVIELEDRAESLEIALARNSKADGKTITRLMADNALLDEENGRLWFAVESARRGIVSVGIENAANKKRLHKNMASLLRMVENGDDDIQIIANCIVAIVDTGGEYKRTRIPRAA